MRGDEARAADRCACGHHRGEHDVEVGCLAGLLGDASCECSEFVGRNR